MTSLADVLILDTASMQWRLAKETATRPRARFFHTATSLEQDARVVIFGGATGSTEGEDQAFLNDTWLFLTRASSWEPCQVAGKPPSPRAAHTRSVRVFTNPARRLRWLQWAGEPQRSVDHACWLATLGAGQQRHWHATYHPWVPHGIHSWCAALGASSSSSS